MTVFLFSPFLAVIKIASSGYWVGVFPPQRVFSVYLLLVTGHHTVELRFSPNKTNLHQYNPATDTML